MSVPAGSGGITIKALRSVSTEDAKNNQQIRVCTYYFKGNKECLLRCMKENNWIEEKDECPGKCVYTWFGNHVNHYARSGDIKLALTSRHQRSSRLDGMRVLAFKEHSQICLERLRSLFPEKLPFFPRGWCLPDEQAEFEKALKKSSNLPQEDRVTYIVKPSETSQGSGIFLVQTPEHLPAHFNERGRNYVAQEYIKDPMLLDGFKFDLRLYVIVLSVDPLRVYLSREGMVRICSEQYNEPAPDNLSDVFSHLTNYSLNKKNENYVFTKASVNQSQQSSDDELNSELNNTNTTGGCNILTLDTGDNNCSGLEEKNEKNPSSSYTSLPSIYSAASPSPMKSSPLLAKRPGLNSPGLKSLSARSMSSNSLDPRGSGSAGFASPVQNIKVAKYSLAKRRTSFMEAIEDRSVDRSVDSNERSGSGEYSEGILSPKASLPDLSLYSPLPSLSSDDFSYGKDDAPYSPIPTNNESSIPQSTPTKSSFLSARRSSLTLNTVGSISFEYDDLEVTQIQQISMQQPSAGFKERGSGAGGGGGGLGGALARRNRLRLNSSSSSSNSNPSSNLSGEVGGAGGGVGGEQTQSDNTQFQIFVNHFTAKDFINFSGLYPTIANKLVSQHRPFKSKKQMYACLHDTEVSRLKKYDKLISINPPPASFDVSKVKRPAYRASTGTINIPAECLSSAGKMSSNSSENGSISQNNNHNKNSNQYSSMDDKKLSHHRVSSKSGRRRYCTTGSFSKNDAHTGVIPKPTQQSGNIRDSSSTPPTSEPNSARLSSHSNPISSRVSTPNSNKEEEGDDAEGEEEEVDLGIEESDGPPGSKRRLEDVFPVLASEYDFDEDQFWTSTVDLVAKTLIALQPELALKYRDMFPKRKRRGANGADIESSEEEDDDDDDDESDDGRKGMVAAHQLTQEESRGRRQRKGKKPQKTGQKKSARDPLRPQFLDESIKEVNGEEGDDSFRCFQLLGFDVILDQKGQPYLLEINSNPSLNIMHECRNEDGSLTSELSPIDEKIKMTVMRDMLRISFGTGKLPEDKDAQSLGSLIPVVTKARYHMYREFMVLERIRHVFEHCCGVRYRKAGGVGSTAFQRVGRKLKVKAAIADLVFVKACSSYRVPGYKLDHLDLSQFTDTLYELCVADGEDSFAFKHLESFKSEEDDGENLRSDILIAAVEQYFNDDEDDDDDDDTDDEDDDDDDGDD